ncbi:hypothetical protein AEAC466_20410 [Asticcacaulis sp. AC466]|uniref:hypothetical protein n=1 Tax=Asticcacaulis sp. AC466 TaxID=1282362 RepID=UPI0003C3D450|nr:hypothetical protein [Asticcacaulis sp. AC466]ESQ81788.1 hypothetical protein AEAC466_20410 [Asticcacaulis sp. AC466]
MRVTSLIPKLTIPAFGCMLLATSACSPNQEPFKEVQFCLNNPNGVSELKTELMQISSAEKMKYIDASEKTYDQLALAHSPVVKNVPRSKYISIYVGKEAGMGLNATNLGLGTDQVVVSFFEGNDKKFASDFSIRVLEQFAKRWRLHEVAKKSGAFPLKCSEEN